MSGERIVICDAQVPFARGGAEMLCESLRDELVRRGFEVDLVALPFGWPTRVDVLKSCLAWRLIDLTEAAGKRIDPGTLRLDRSGAATLNEFDLNAVEEALRVKEAAGVIGNPLSMTTFKP